MPVSFRKAPLVAAIALATTASLTHAQRLEEVIVTAQKRTESLQDVPISVSAIQGDKIQEAGINNMAALADYVPNLQISEGTVDTSIYLRGMGSGNNAAFEQSVGMYIDGIYMGRGRQYRSPFVDIERVEVLRGPQGTLFGKNTVAGAVNVTTASPDVGDEFSGSISAAVEDNDGYIVDGFLSGSVTDNMAMRLAFKTSENDGTFDNTYLGEDELNVEDTLFRFTTVWQPTDNLDINFKYSHSDYERTGAPSTTKRFLSPEQRDADVPNRSSFAEAAYVLTDQFYPEIAQQSKKEFVTFKDNNFGVDRKTVGIGTGPDGSENTTDNAVLKLDYQMGDFLVTSITGFSSYDYVDAVDVDWLPLQFIDRGDDQEFEQFSQEFRITSPGGEFFDYVAGVYYEQSDLEFDRRVTVDSAMDGLFQFAPANAFIPSFPDGVTAGDLGVQSLAQFIGITLGADYRGGQVGRDHHYQLDSDSWAVFGQGTFNISDTFRLTVGLRYTEESKEVSSSQTLFDDILGIGVPNYDPTVITIQAGSFNTYIYDYKEDRDTDKWLPAANLQWDVGDDSMLYLSLSQGFKSGGFSAADDGEPGTLSPGDIPGPDDPVVFTTPNGDFEFEDEEVDALEIGGKHTLLDGGMTLNWAYFYTEYDNLQTSVFKGVGFGVTNAASTTVQGIEIDAMWQATDDLRLGANVAWLDAEYEDFKDAPCTAKQVDFEAICGGPGSLTNNDLSGQSTSYAPEYSAALFFDYSHMMSGGMEFFAGGEVNYKDDFTATGDNDPFDLIESYSKTNLRVGLRGEAWEVMAYGRNIFDEEVFNNSFDTPVLAGSHSVVMDEGAVFGLRGRYSF